MSSRETIARIIDPEGWETFDHIVKRMTEIKGLPANDEDVMREGVNYYTRRSFAKADAIIALSEGKSATEGEWRPIEEHQGHGPVLVSTAPDSPKYLFSEPVSAFLDVTGVWRCLGSIGGGAELARQPTHFRPLPASPTGEDR